NLVGENHPEYADSLHCLAQLYRFTNQTELAARSARRALRLMQGFLDRTGVIQCDRQRLASLRQSHHYLDTYLACVAAPDAAAAPDVFAIFVPGTAAAPGRGAENRLPPAPPAPRPRADDRRRPRATLARHEKMTPATQEQREGWVKRFDALEAEVERLQRT